MRRVYASICTGSAIFRDDWAVGHTLPGACSDTGRSTMVNSPGARAGDDRGMGRYAPSTTGHAHPGTLLAALLCWLDARSVGDRVVLRLENLDPERSRPDYEAAMIEDLRWLGLEWDAIGRQSDSVTHHEQALDDLAAAGLLYPCACTRAQIRESGSRTPDGGYRYGGRCRSLALPDGGWRRCADPLRVKLPSGNVEPVDLGGLPLGQDPSAAFGDPIVRRRDGSIAYGLACVVDDAASGVTRIVRGRDLMASTATQVALQRLLGVPTPSYRHHLVLLERRGDKLAKLHGSVATTQLREVYSASELGGLLAYAAGLLPEPLPITPSELLVDFAWDRVSREDKIAHWSGKALEVLPASESGG